jgi:hypothetical protein
MGVELFRADRQTEVKLKVTFRNFANAPKKGWYLRLWTELVWHGKLAVIIRVRMMKRWRAFNSRASSLIIKGCAPLGIVELP